MATHKMARFLFLVMALTLQSCSFGKTGNILVGIPNTQSTTEPEIIHLNNCGGKADTEQIAQRSQSVDIAREADIGISYQILEASVTTKYSKSNSVTKSQRLVAPSGTNMEFTLLWTEEVQSGAITVEGKSGQATYRINTPIAVELTSSKELGCGAETAGNTNTQNNPPAVPVQPVDTPIPQNDTPIPPTVALPPTPSGPILSVGQTWTQDGMALTLQKVDIGTDRINALFVLENNTSNQILFTFGNESFWVQDNLGNNGSPWIYQSCIPQINSCMAGGGDSSLRAGDSLQIDIEFSGLSLTKTQVTEIFITVKEISRVNNVNWLVVIPH